MDFLGSSPHTRDKFHMCMPVLAFPRIIPAYAGQMPCPQGTSKGRRDHPRIRGTNSVFRLIQALLSGSSPHTRDKYPLPKIRPCRSRIIPAYAGQINARSRSRNLDWDHPRIRGTNLSVSPAK